MIDKCRPAAENQKIKCNEPMGYTTIFIFKENALFERKSKAKKKKFLTFDLNYAKT
jgi:hypothetical protein